ncbi:MAG: peptide deformylase [Caldisericaceae bacterium]|nr:peptide deformylase [Caldisericaceae bacterium]RLD19138.1 MAG: peptide deformylase [Caldisericota bacterium]
MKIITYGNPVLRKKAQKIKSIDKKIVDLVKKMFKTMDAGKVPGVGLAAPQVGVSIALFVYKVDDDKGVVINPVIVSKKGEEVKEEGCLSVPGVYGPVKRAEKIIVKGLNIKGKRFKLNLDGLKARVFQHETDHLNGIIFTDYIEKIEEFTVEEGYKLPEQLVERFKEK